MSLVLPAIPTAPGGYLLCLGLSKPEWIQVGRLGSFCLTPGHYIYLGSAYGPGGLRARLGRHLRGNGRMHWHIDALRQVGQVEVIGYRTDPIHTRLEAPLECQWSQILTGLPWASVAVAGFGASDCRYACPAHLVAFPARMSLRTLFNRLQKILGDDAHLLECVENDNLR